MTVVVIVLLVLVAAALLIGALILGERAFVGRVARDLDAAQATVDAFIARHGPDPGPPTLTCPQCGSTDVDAVNVTTPWSDGWQWIPGICRSPAHAPE